MRLICISSPTMDTSHNWQVTKRNIAQRGSYILKTGQWMDCKFSVGQRPHQKIIEGHKLILTMSSPVFDAMLFGRMAEEDGPIPIPDVRPEVFEALLEYIYMDNVNFKSFELACELCYCAKKYILPFLEETCTKFISLNLSPEKACLGYEFAKLFEKPVLMENCLEIIHAEANTILKSPSFEEIQLETLVALFEMEKLQINSEIELVFAAERWASSECMRKGLNPEDGKSLRSVIGNALTKIRFLTLSAKKFAASPARSSLLKESEAFAILMNITCSEREWPMPQGFSTDVALRKKRMIKSSPDLRQCQRDKIENVEWLDTEDLVSSVTFTVDKDIRIIGIKVPAQTRMDKKFKYDNYTENLFVKLYDTNDTELIEKHFSPDVAIDDLVELKFDEPICIKKNQVYRVVVNFKVPGAYPMAQCWQEISCDDSVCFSFKVGNGIDDIQDGLIRSIIFARDTYYYN